MTYMKNNDAMHKAVSALLALIDEQVPNKPTYWHGTPLEYDFPLSGDRFTWLWSTLNELEQATRPEDGEWYDEDEE